MSKLLKYISVLLFILCVGYKSYSQVAYPARPYRVGPGRRFNNGMNAERRVGSIKVNYIRNRLNLPPDQAQRFFPLYEEYQQELFNLRKLKKQNAQNADGADQVNKELFYDDQILKLKMKFNNAFLKVLPPDKVSE